MRNPKSILITGASSGIGEALALLYADKGIFLALNGRNSERLEAVALKCQGQGATVESKVVDVSHQADMNDWIKDVNAMNPIDLVIANAGISGGIGNHPHGEPVENARKIFDVNVNGVFNTIEPIIEIMAKRTLRSTQGIRGQIALVSSLAGYRGWSTAPAYTASKGAVRFYGEAQRSPLAQQKIELNVICPGFVTSRITAKNNFSMPMKISAEKAANIIKSGLEKNKGRIAFPAPVHFVTWLISILPDSFAQWLINKAPKKQSL